MCSPRLLGERQLPLPTEVLSELPLLHLRPEHRSRWFDWEGLFRALGIASLPTPGALRFDNYTLLIQAAIAGQGVALDIAELFLNTAFEGGRHLRRINQIEG